MVDNGTGEPRMVGPGETSGDAALLPREFGLRRHPETAVAVSKVMAPPVSLVVLSSGSGKSAIVTFGNMQKLSPKFHNEVGVL